MLSGSYKNIGKIYIPLFIVIIIFSGCKKDEVEPVVPETGTVTDIDNNVYRTVKIGNQWWMAENLKVKTFRNGNPIRESQTDLNWIDSTASYCLFDNNTNSPGLLYNWYAASNDIAPEGWRIPTDADWKELEKYLGMNSTDADKKGWRGTHEAEKLMLEGTKGWTASEGVWGTNESGFSALAGGCRLYDGTWGNPGLFATGFWWSSDNLSGCAWYRYIDYKKASIFRSTCSLNYGFSIRCLKN